MPGQTNVPKSTTTAPHMQRMVLQWMGGAGSSLQGKKVLDVGVGLGLSSEMFATYGAKVDSLEPAPLENLAAQVQYKSGGCVNPIRGMVQSLGGHRNNYDIVNVGFAASTEEARTIAGRLKPGGFLIAPVEEGGGTFMMKVRRSCSSF